MARVWREQALTPHLSSLAHSTSEHPCGWNIQLMLSTLSLFLCCTIIWKNCTLGISNFVPWLWNLKFELSHGNSTKGLFLSSNDSFRYYQLVNYVQQTWYIKVTKRGGKDYVGWEWHDHYSFLICNSFYYQTEWDCFIVTFNRSKFCVPQMFWQPFWHVSSCNGPLPCTWEH